MIVVARSPQSIAIGSSYHAPVGSPFDLRAVSRPAGVVVGPVLWSVMLLPLSGRAWRSFHLVPGPILEPLDVASSKIRVVHEAPFELGDPRYDQDWNEK